MTTRFVPPIPVLPAGYSSYNKYTAGVFHAYADSSMPDDTGDGLSWLTAKKTLAAAVAVLPDIAEDHVVLHLKGSFEIGGKIISITTAISGNDKLFVIDGGDDVTVVEGPYTATSSTTTSLTDTARSWAINALRGYAVEILDGPAIGYAYPIQSNTADTLVVGKTWTAPGMCQYRVVKPTTVISGATYAWFYFAGKTAYRVSFQRFRVSGAAFVGATDGVALFSICEINNVMYARDSAGAVSAAMGTSFGLGYTLIDPANPAASLDTSKRRIGFVHRGHTSSSYTAVYAGHTGALIFAGPCVVDGPVDVKNLEGLYVRSGCFIKKIILFGVGRAELGQTDSYGTQTIIGESGDVGIEAKDSRVLVTKNFVIQNCSFHAIQLDNSTLECQSAILSGSGNGGAGVYLKNRSSVIFKDGYTPTLTGTAGDIAVTSETAADATWAQVAAGDPVEIMPDGSVKEVP